MSTNNNPTPDSAASAAVDQIGFEEDELDAEAEAESGEQQLHAESSLNSASQSDSSSASPPFSPAAPQPAPCPGLVSESSRHVNYFVFHLRSLPFAYLSLDSNRLTALHFILAGLAMLGALETLADSGIVKKSEIKKLIDLCANSGPDGLGGCSGSTADRIADSYSVSLPATYSAMISLKLLGFPLFDSASSAAVNRSLSAAALSSGSFQSCRSSFDSGLADSDIRFVYCACVISHLQNDWSALPIARLTAFIQSCQRFDGGFGLNPGNESHGGSTYCAAAAVNLLWRAGLISSPDSIIDVAAMISWCLSLQGNGFAGRINKPKDSCYSFWLGSVLDLYGTSGHANWPSNAAFIFDCSGPSGGFSREIGAQTDLAHTYFSLCGLSLSGLYEWIKPIDAAVGLVKSSSLNSDSPKSN